ncbi:translation initiation factor IF-2-like [Harpia harpyja]|uniref:translation initiation factor IF-2-like n=1 Tax=Harpia harpyja TaxID=202280 RepID=UPI0022B09EA5|nr:translation initiation factor IF-2-like [Harpia harpyja]
MVWHGTAPPRPALSPRSEPCWALSPRAESGRRRGTARCPDGRPGPGEGSTSRRRPGPRIPKGPVSLRGSAGPQPAARPLQAARHEGAAAASLPVRRLVSRLRSPNTTAAAGRNPRPREEGARVEGGTASTPHPRRRRSAAPRSRRERRAGQLLPATFPPPSTTRVHVRGVCAPVYRRGPGAGQPRPAGASGRSGVSAAATAEAGGRSHRGRGGLGAPPSPPPPARPDLTRGGRRLPQAPPASPLRARPRGARGEARSPEAEPRSPPDRLLGRARVDGRGKRFPSFSPSYRADGFVRGRISHRPAPAAWAGQRPESRCPAARG